jgi:hypothetical protein
LVVACRFFGLRVADLRWPLAFCVAVGHEVVGDVPHPARTPLVVSS